MPTVCLHGTHIEYRSENHQKPPKHIEEVKETSAASILASARNGTATLWRGDFHNAKQVLAALKKRIRPFETIETDPQTAFHKHRLAQSQYSRLVNMLLVEISSVFTLSLPRAPDVTDALTDVYTTFPNQPFLLPLNQLLGFIGAYQWHKKGIYINELSGKIHVPFGVFSPLRGEYLSLLKQAPLPSHVQTAFDIGTGSGVIALLLAKRGVRHITATDNQIRALNCARANINRFGMNKYITLVQQNLFPMGQADLIVCNPPWLPTKPTSTIETALYDPNHSMLKAFLNEIPKHLKSNGEAWLVMSDLAEHLQLRSPHALQHWASEAGLQMSKLSQTTPKHPKATNPKDPLAFARMRECTFLYRLTPIENIP